MRILIGKAYQTDSSEPELGGLGVDVYGRLTVLTEEGLKVDGACEDLSFLHTFINRHNSQKKRRLPSQFWTL